MTTVFLRLSGQPRKRLSQERALETMTTQSGMQRPVGKAFQRGEVSVVWSRKSNKRGQVSGGDGTGVGRHY